MTWLQQLPLSLLISCKILFHCCDHNIWQNQLERRKLIWILTSSDFSPLWQKEDHQYLVVEI